MRMPAASPGDRIGYSAFNAVAEGVAANQIRTGSRTTRGSFPRQRRVVSYDTGLDLSGVHFGIEYTGAVATIKAGLVFHPLGDPITVAETEKTITATAQYIGIEYPFATALPIITDPNTDIPAPDATHWRQPLFQFTLSSGVITAVTVCHLGDITVPGYAGPAS